MARTPGGPRSRLRRRPAPGQPLYPWELPGIEPGTYQITSQFNPDDVIFSVDEEAGLTDGANVYMDAAGAVANQEWEVTEVEDGVYRIAAAADTSLVLEASDGGTDTGTNLVLGEWEGADYQKLAGNPVSPGRFTLEPTHADLAVDVWEIDPEPSVDLRHWNLTGADNQTFLFEEP